MSARASSPAPTVSAAEIWWASNALPVSAGELAAAKTVTRMPRPSDPPSWWATLTRPNGRARVVGADAGDTGGGERAQRAALSDAHQDHGQREVGDVGRVRGQAAQPRHPDEGDRAPAASSRALPQRRVSFGTVSATTKLTTDNGRNASPASQRRVVVDALQELGDEEPEGEHRAEVEDAGRVGAGSLPISEQPQRHDRLAARHSFTTSPTSSSTPRVSAATVPPSFQPVGGADDAVDERGHAQRRTSGAGDVEPARPRSVSGRKRGAASIMAMPIGTLMKKPTRHETSR